MVAAMAKANQNTVILLYICLFANIQQYYDFS